MWFKLRCQDGYWKPAEWRNTEKSVHLLFVEARDNWDINASVELNKAQNSTLYGFIICSQSLVLENRDFPVASVCLCNFYALIPRAFFGCCSWEKNLFCSRWRNHQGTCPNKTPAEASGAGSLSPKASKLQWWLSGWLMESGQVAEKTGLVAHTAFKNPCAICLNTSSLQILPFW